MTPIIVVTGENSDIICHLAQRSDLTKQPANRHEIESIALAGSGLSALHHDP
jgi:hypothetical protein